MTSFLRLLDGLVLEVQLDLQHWENYENGAYNDHTGMAGRIGLVENILAVWRGWWSSIWTANFWSIVGLNGCTGRSYGFNIPIRARFSVRLSCLDFRRHLEVS